MSERFKMGHTETSAQRALMPHEYEMVWHLMVEGPSTAAELAHWRNAGRRGREWTAQRIAPQLRALVTRGWVARAGTGHYSATDRAIEAVSW